MLTKPIVFFDLETTGPNPTKDRIVSLFMVKLGPDLNVLGVDLSTLVNPGIPIPAESTVIHGITDEMVASAPPFKEIASDVLNYLGSDTLGGYNIATFDVPLLSEEFGRCGINWPVGIPVIVDAYKIFAIKERRDLAAAVKFYTRKDIDNAHDAGGDVASTIDVFAGQLAMYPDLSSMDESSLNGFCNQGITFLDLAGKIYLNKDNVPCYAFGKSKDVPVMNDRGFGDWMLRETSDFPANTKAVVRSILYKK